MPVVRILGKLMNEDKLCLNYSVRLNDQRRKLESVKPQRAVPERSCAPQY